MTNHPGVGAGASPLLEMYAIWYHVEIAPVCSGASLGASRLVLGKMQIMASTRTTEHGCQIAKFYPFLSLDCARVGGVGAQSKERKGSNFAA